MSIWTNTNDSQWIDVLPDVTSYVNGQCTDRYGVPMGVVCTVHVIDDNQNIVGYGTTTSGTGLFSIQVIGIPIDSKVLTTYSYDGVYNSLSYLSGAEFITTTSGSL